MNKFLAVALTLMVFACGAKKETFENKEYKMTEAPANAEVTIAFDAKDKRFSGKSAVNRYFGTYTVEGETLTFGPAGATMMMGPQELMSVEQDYLKSLGEIKSFTLEGTKLTLHTQDNGDIVFEEIVTQK